MRNDRTFEYVIVGSGTAGCVLANRLSADPNTRVLLLEAGDSDESFAQIQLLDLGSLFAAWGPSTDWGFVTENEPGLHGRQMPITQGRVFGGGSSVNGRITLRGNRRDYDHWNHLGNEGWSYRDVLPYFKKYEDYLGGESEYHGVDGPVTIQDQTAPSESSQALVAAAVEVFGAVGPVDLNGARQENAAGFVPHTTTRDMRRASMVVAYIRPIMDRPNFSVEIKATATRVLFEGNRAVGVEYLQNGQLRQVRANAEVIVSAGPFGSAKLLMLSGVGPSDHLRSHNIAVVADLPGVGQNLQDHLLGRMSWTVQKEQPAPIMIAESTFFTYTRPGIEAGSPNIQLLTSPFLFPEVAAAGPGFTIVPALQQAHSTGSVSLRSANPLDPPVLRLNYLTSERDLDDLVAGIKLGRELVSAQAFAGIRGRELQPGPDVKTDEEIKEYLRASCITEWHPSCTCKMGYDAMSVVDPQLRVRGTSGLRVIDASIMPKIVNANLMATVIMIGEKGADMVLRDMAA